VEDDAERLFREKGMRLLRARNEIVEHKGARFNLIGVDYQRDHMVSGERSGPMLQEIESLVRRDMPNVLLSPVSYTHLDVYKRQETESISSYGAGNLQTRSRSVQPAAALLFASGQRQTPQPERGLARLVSWQTPAQLRLESATGSDKADGG